MQLSLATEFSNQFVFEQHVLDTYLGKQLP